MKFKVVQSTYSVKATDEAYLKTDNWDDWFKYETTFYLVYFDKAGTKTEIGDVKIGQFNMDQRKPTIPKEFEKLSDQFFSLGQDESFYVKLNGLGDEIRDAILGSLNDISKNESIFQRAIKENVTKISLLRSVNVATVRGQFHRLSIGGARLSPYDFKYISPAIKNMPNPIELEFHVVPESNPPTNVHVLIGRNGVGKTHLLNNMINSVLDNNSNTEKYGIFSSLTAKMRLNMFVNVVFVTFSAFDESEPIPERKDKSKGIQYSYVGLRRFKSDKQSMIPKSTIMLKNEFIKSAESCRRGARFSRLTRAFELLEADPIFKEANIGSYFSIKDDTKFKNEIGKVFKRLSSGHKIVLLTITRLVESVEERSLVLIDEPEAHLHPPLLSALMGALSDLLIHRNGVAIIATHSPVVVQEVPKSCVWMLRRTGNEAKVERLDAESFGENVGSLTREVFGLEVTHSGFHKKLYDAVKDDTEYEGVLEKFKNQLGFEARAILRGLIISKSME